MLKTSFIDRIRHIFLDQRPYVSIETATELLGWTSEEMTQAISAGEIELMTTPVSAWFWREELMAKAFESWPLEAIEEALGVDREHVLPELLRLEPLEVRIPRYQRLMLHELAERDGITPSDVLARELEGAASLYLDELRNTIPGLAEVLLWPNGRDTQVC